MIDLEHAREELRLRETEDLVEILVKRDEDEWRPEVFGLVEQVLRERGVSADQAVEARRRAVHVGTPEPPGHHEAPEQRPVLLAAFDDEVEAKLCLMALGHAGIEGTLRPGASATADLFVDEADIEEAQRVLAEAEAGDEDAEGSEGFRCGSCGFIAEPLSEAGRLVCQVCGEAN